MQAAIFGVTAFGRISRAAALLALALAACQTAPPTLPPKTSAVIAADVASAAPAPDPALLDALTTAWPGPYGGLPPVDRATPAAIEAAFLRSIAAKRAEIAAIASNTAAPTFENTIAALDASGVALLRIERLLQIFMSTASNAEIAAVGAKLLPLSSALEDEIAFDGALFARVAAIYQNLPQSAPTPTARRLVSVMYQDLARRGAALDEQKRARLKVINARLAALIAQFSQNTSREEESLVAWVEDAAELAGLSDERIAAAKAAAVKRAQPNKWAIPTQRPSVWPVLTKARSRALRERVFRLWESRGNNRGAFDNAPIMTEILTLRGEKARLLGFATYAHFATAQRMSGTPEVAGAMLDRAWQLLLPQTRKEIAALQAIVDAERGGFKIAPWDRIYYAEKLRQQQFGLDADAVRPYLTLQNVMDGMMWAAQQTYGLTFREIKGVPIVAADIRVYEVSRAQQLVGVLYVDMFQRVGKGPASWCSEYRPAVRGTAEILPVAALHSNVVHPADGSAPLLTWEVANVIFHEFGHALHMLSNTANYRSLGMLRVPADFIETPALLNERWLLDRAVLRQFARHHQTGAPMPEELIGKIERALKHDRIFSVNLDYLATAIVDLRMHLKTNGQSLDAVAEERAVLAALDAPPSVTPLLRVSHAYHTFTELYGSAVYTYLWSDALSADIGEAFLAAPGGLFDAEVAARYRRTILDAANTRDIREAFREFRGRDPDPDALFRRFNLLAH